MNKPHIAGSPETGWLVFLHDRPELHVCEEWWQVVELTLTIHKARQQPIIDQQFTTTTRH